MTRLLIRTCALTLLCFAAGCSSDSGAAADGGPGDLFQSDALPGDGQVASDAPACTPRPFLPPGQPEGWRHTKTKLLVVTQGPANHRAQDVVVAAGAPQRIVGKFAYGPFDKDLEEEDVETFVQRDPPCGPWVSLGVQRTSKDGQHGRRFGIEDDGGRIYLEIPAAQALPVGRYPMRSLVKGDHSVAAFSLTVVPPGTEAVVFDIDGTLTTDDFELITQIFDQLASGQYQPKAYAGGAAVVQAWAQRGYLPVFITGRPDWLRRITVPWLAGQQMPRGPLHLTDKNGQALPSSSGVGAYKTAFLNTLKAQGVSLVAAYGNASTDIQAYAAAGVAKERTFIIGKHGGDSGTTAIADYPSHLPWVQALAPAKVSIAPASHGW